MVFLALFIGLNLVAADGKFKIDHKCRANVEERNFFWKNEISLQKVGAKMLQNFQTVKLVEK